MPRNQQRRYPHHGGSADVRSFHGPFDSHEDPKRLPNNNCLLEFLRNRAAGSEEATMAALETDYDRKVSE
jgi:hypothetical protein